MSCKRESEISVVSAIVESIDGCKHKQALGLTAYQTRLNHTPSASLLSGSSALLQSLLS
jgi:hypothetical protein